MTNRIGAGSRRRAFDGGRIRTAACIVVALNSFVPWIGFGAQVFADAPTISSISSSESAQIVDQTVGDSAALGAPDLSRLDAFHAVQEANKKLLSGDADRALELYGVAAKHQPDAREVALGRGLGHYAKQEFDLAKDEFLKAASGKNDGLGADAAYAAAACDHAAALGSQGDPKAAVSKLENAMRGYRDVLSTHPEHPSARDADRKAAMTWRNLKQQMQQQKQQQDKNKSDKQNDQEKQEQDKNQGEEKDDEKKDDDQPQSEQNQDSKQNQDQDQQQQSSQQDDSKEDEQQKQASSDQQQDQEDASKKNGDEKQDQKDANAQQDSDLSKDPQESREAKAMQEQKEEASREQAERKLREMMQAVRQRRKDHRNTQQPVQVMPVDKDW